MNELTQKEVNALEYLAGAYLWSITVSPETFKTFLKLEAKGLVVFTRRRDGSHDIRPAPTK